MYMTHKKPCDYCGSVKSSGFKSHLTFVSNLVQLSGQPPFGGTVGATVLLAGVEPGRLQIDLCSWPQLHVAQKPVNSVARKQSLAALQFIFTDVVQGYDSMKIFTLLTHVICHHNTVCSDVIGVWFVFIPPL